MATEQQSDCGCGGTASGVAVGQQVDPLACTQYATAEVCAQATISLTPTVTPGTPVVSCVDGLVIGPCADISGFTPLPNTGVCTFTVSQVICVTIPLDFSVDVTATPSGGACGPVVSGTVCPPLPTA